MGVVIILQKNQTSAKGESLYFCIDKKKGVEMPRKSKFDSAYKAKVAIEAIKENKTLPGWQ